jgi:hypothetical protein
LELGDFNVNEDGAGIFKPAIGNDSLHEISNDNGVRVVNLATFYSQNYNKDKRRALENAVINFRVP